jgi:hypothetical protein
MNALPAGEIELSVRAFVGAVLSTRTDPTVAEVKVLPALSVVTTRRS